MAKVARTNDRVLLAEFDSTEQVAGMSGAGWLVDYRDRDSAVLRDALGKLRLEALLSERIVVTDAQALDGRMLLGLASSGLLKSLRTDPEKPMPMELRARRSNIQDTIAAMHQPKDADTGFRSSFLSDGARVADVMAESLHGKARLRFSSDVLKCLDESGAASDQLEALAEGWAKLAELTDSGALPHRTWAEGRPFADAVSLSDAFLPISALAASFAADESESVFMQGLGAEMDRSRFLNAVSQWDGRAEIADALTFWFDERYNRAIAFQHNADFRSIHSGLVGRAYFGKLDNAVGSSRRTVIQLPEGFLDLLGNLTTSEWQKGYSEVKNGLTPWWKEGEAGSLEGSLERLVKLLGASEGGQSSDDHPKGPAFARVIAFGVPLFAPVATLALNPDPFGVAATLVVELGVLAAQRLAYPGTEQKCAVTDYLDDVATA